MKFDFAIGNPPYQDNTLGENETYAPPVYNAFIDASYEVADKVELIHPARFLFNAGSTPKAWNQKMLSDEHFKVLYYEQDSSKVFANTDIKGGVAVTYHNNEQIYGAIEVFTPYIILNRISNRLSSLIQKSNISQIIHTKIVSISIIFMKTILIIAPLLVVMVRINVLEITLLIKFQFFLKRKTLKTM